MLVPWRCPRSGDKHQCERDRFKEGKEQIGRRKPPNQSTWTTLVISRTISAAWSWAMARLRIMGIMAFHRANQRSAFRQQVLTRSLSNSSETQASRLNNRMSTLTLLRRNSASSRMVKCHLTGRPRIPCNKIDTSKHLEEITSPSPTASITTVVVSTVHHLNAYTVVPQDNVRGINSSWRSTQMPFNAVATETQGAEEASRISSTLTNHKHGPSLLSTISSSGKSTTCKPLRLQKSLAFR